MSTLKFKCVRYGGLNVVKQKNNYNNPKNISYHTAPQRKGFYAFPFGIVDLFLISHHEHALSTNKKNNKKYRERKVFDVLGGLLWTHIYHEKSKELYLDKSNDFYLINVFDFKDIILKKEISTLIKECNKNKSILRGINHRGNHFEGNPLIFYSNTHFELFLTRDTKINT